ncbi:type II toxin-antitoxin system RelE/ParE family toxin [Streptomyces sp. CT34]|uniref:type II toxin-antitoxin system RelE family toxin n=1 Tax=Streptomyces sp. CT34 TaxID=1553907 RepID=UPI0032204C10
MTKYAPVSAWNASEPPRHPGRARTGRGHPLPEGRPEGLRQRFASIDLLAEHSRPEGSIPYGSPDLRRIHSGRYRALYRINDSIVTIIVVHVGRTSRAPRHRRPRHECLA